MVIFRRDKDGVDPGERALWGDLMSLGLTFPLCIVLGFFLGRWIGGWFGHATGGQWIGLAWGVSAAFWELYKVSRRMSKRDEEELRRSQEPPSGKHGGEDGR
ncbi:MAG TPA: AtpZ/AtpI family protein [Holophagaceae bacterium]